jgi:hypothetical protein
VGATVLCPDGRLITLSLSDRWLPSMRVHPGTDLARIQTR